MPQGFRWCDISVTWRRAVSCSPEEPRLPVGVRRRGEERERGGGRGAGGGGVWGLQAGGRAGGQDGERERERRRLPAGSVCSLLSPR